MDNYFLRSLEQGNFTASPSVIPGEWVVTNDTACYTDGKGPMFRKTFRGPRAQLDAQTLAYLLNKEESK